MRARLAQALRAARLALPGRYARSAYGPLMVKRPKDLTFQFSVDGETGYYGSQIRDLIRWQEAEFVFLDIGANQGIFSLIAATHPRCSAVLAFEPVPDTFAALVENIEVNGLGAKITPFCGAVSARAAPALPMSYDPAHSGASQIVGAGAGARLFAPVIGTAFLESVVPAEGGRLVVKIDVEGAEADVLAALGGASFFGRIRDMVVEVSARMPTWPENVPGIYAAMAAHGFRELTDRPDLAQDFHYDAHFHRD